MIGVANHYPMKSVQRHKYIKSPRHFLSSLISLQIFHLYNTFIHSTSPPQTSINARGVTVLDVGKWTWSSDFKLWTKSFALKGSNPSFLLTIIGKYDLEGGSGYRDVAQTRPVAPKMPRGPLSIPVKTGASGTRR